MSERQITTDERREIIKVIDKAVEKRQEVIKANDPQFDNRVFERTRKLAIGKLKIDNELVEIDRIDKQMADLEDRKKTLVQKAESKLPLTGKLKTVKYRDEEDYAVCEARETICSAINKIVEALLPGESEKDPTGKKLIAVERTGQRLQAELVACQLRSQIDSKKIMEKVQSIIGN